MHVYIAVTHATWPLGGVYTISPVAGGGGGDEFRQPEDGPERKPPAHY